MNFNKIIELFIKIKSILNQNLSFQFFCQSIFLTLKFLQFSYLISTILALNV